uniref:Uncharacterized protein n=1 Tax=mine drainage metagenome TaxID=410659 RepID=E6PQD5_9ZZZZ
MIMTAVRTSGGLVGGSGGAVKLEGRHGALVLLIAPLRAASLGFGLMQPAAVILFADPHAHAKIPEQRMREAFRLTPAKMRLLVALLNGQKLAEYANVASITYGTARLHLERLLQKNRLSQSGGFDSSSNAKPDGSHLGNLQRMHRERWIERDALNPRGPFLNVSKTVVKDSSGGVYWRTHELQKTTRLEQCRAQSA